MYIVAFSLKHVKHTKKPHLVIPQKAILFLLYKLINTLLTVFSVIVRTLRYLDMVMNYLWE